MNPLKAAEMARALMDKHKLNDWTFKFDTAGMRFGLCRHSKKTISLSINMTAANSEHDVRETILHEIAHALVGARCGHGFEWKMKCVEIGCSYERCYGRHIKNAARGYR